MKTPLPIRECTGYVDPRTAAQRWKAGCKWATKSCRYPFKDKSYYTTEEPPHQCEPCKRQQQATASFRGSRPEGCKQILGR